MSSRAGRHIVLSSTTLGLSAAGTVFRADITSDNTTIVLGKCVPYSGEIVIVNWGDGSISRIESWPNDVTQYPTHTYANMGSYTIIISDSASVVNVATPTGSSYSNLKATSLMAIGSRVTSFGANMFTSSSTLFNPTCVASSSITGFETAGNSDWGAFRGCAALTNLSWLPSGLTGSLQDKMFRDCTSLADISGLPCHSEGGISVIGKFSFYGCTSITDIGNIENISEIDDYAFNNCTGITKYAPNNGVETAFKSETGKPYTRRIGKHAFEGCRNLAYFRISRPAWFEDYAFAQCDALISIKPLSLEYLHVDITMGSSTTDDIIIYDAMTDFVSYSVSGKTVTYRFRDGTQMTSTYSANVTNVVVEERYRDDMFTTTSPHSVVGEGCFQWCDGLKTTAGMPFSNRTWAKDLFLGCTALEEIVDVFANASLDEGTNIGNYQAVLNGNYSNSDFKHQGMTALLTIGEGCFKYCTALESVSMTGVREIGKEAFRGCSSVESFIFSPRVHQSGYFYAGVRNTFPAYSTMETIKEGAFTGCTFGERTTTPTLITDDNCDELLIRIDSHVCPHIERGAFTGARLRSDDFSLFRANVVLQLRTLINADGLYEDTLTADHIQSGTTRPSDFWAEDSVTKSLLRIQTFQEIRQELQTRLPIYEGSINSDVVKSYSRVYVSGTGYVYRNMILSVPFTKKILAAVGTQFSIPILYAGSNWSYPAVVIHPAVMTGWDYAYTTDNNYGPQGHCLLKITDDVPCQISSTWTDGVTRTLNQLALYSYYTYAEDQLVADQTIVSVADTSELADGESLNLKDRTFVANLAGGTEMDSTSNPSFSIEVNGTATQAYTTVTGKSYVVDQYHPYGQWCPILKFTNNINVPKGKTAIVRASTKIQGSTKPLVKADFWPMLPNEVTRINVDNGYYST